MPRRLCSPCTHTHTEPDTEHGTFHSWLGACEAVKKGEGGGSGGWWLMCVCVWPQKRAQTHTSKCIHTDKRRLIPTRKIFVEITLHPWGGKLETGIISLRFSSPLSLSLSRPPPPSFPLLPPPPFISHRSACSHVKLKAESV